MTLTHAIASSGLLWPTLAAGFLVVWVFARFSQVILRVLRRLVTRLVLRILEAIAVMGSICVLGGAGFHIVHENWLKPHVTAYLSSGTSLQSPFHETTRLLAGSEALWGGVVGGLVVGISLFIWRNAGSIV